MATESAPAPPGGRDKPTGDPHELLRHYLTIYDSYHNHKEVMAYAVTALYLGGAATLFVGNPFWSQYDRIAFALLICFLILLAGIAFAFVRHQLMLRRSAGEMFKACSRLTSKWLAEGPKVSDLAEDDTALDQVLFVGFIWPKALRVEMELVKGMRRRKWWARDLTYTAMIGSGILVLLRIVLTWTDVQSILRPTTVGL